VPDELPGVRRFAAGFDRLVQLARSQSFGYTIYQQGAVTFIWRIREVNGAYDRFNLFTLRCCLVRESGHESDAKAFITYVSD